MGLVERAKTGLESPFVRSAVKRDRKHFREALEVVIGREDLEVETCRDGADQEVSIGALHTFLAAPIEVGCGFFVVRSRDLDVRKRT